MSHPPHRVLPQLTDRNRHFWEGGRGGTLVVLRCEDCGYFIHPPVPICPWDLSKRVVPTPVTGRGVLVSYTINYQPWLAGFDPPYVIGLVELEEQSGLRLTTNIVECPIDAVESGMAVQVKFERYEDPQGDVWLPLFEPAAKE